jgi:hypothetical protein
VLRLHVDVLVKVDEDAEDDEYTRMRCTGVELATTEVADIIGGDLNAPPVKFGDFQVCCLGLQTVCQSKSLRQQQATSSWTFETASRKYWELQNAVFVGSTSFRAGQEEGTFVVGFKIAKVVSAKTDISV